MLWQQSRILSLWDLPMRGGNDSYDSTVPSLVKDCRKRSLQGRSALESRRKEEDGAWSRVESGVGIGTRGKGGRRNVLETSASKCRRL